MKRLLIIVSILFWFSLGAQAQLEIDTTSTPIQMVQALQGKGVTFSNIQVNCPGVNQMAEFDGTLSNIGLDSGLLMTTGDAWLAKGPNLNDGQSGNTGFPGDSDLDQVIAPDNTNEACVVDFDLRMSGDTLRFNYVFGSEEYPEFTKPDDFNDVFGFFISGPGVSGPYSNNSDNVALLPNGYTVSIFNINNGNDGDDFECSSGGANGPCINCQYYVDNCGGQTVNYDGFTTVLTVKVAVQPCALYHLKLAIADAVDGSYDSGVFLENGSFVSSQLEYATEFTDVFEGCTEGTIHFSRKDTNSNQDSIRMDFVITGTATNVIDYGLLLDDGSLVEFPDHIRLNPFENEKTFTIKGIDDGINEPDESIIINLDVLGCQNESIAQDSLYIVLHDDIYLDFFPDTLVCPGEEIDFGVYFDAPIYSIVDLDMNGESISFDFLLNNSIYDENEGLYKADSSFTFSAIEDTSLIFTITDSFECTGHDTLVYDVLEPDLTDFTYVYADPGNPNIIQFVNLSRFPDGTKYRWEFGDSSGVISLTKEPLHVFPDTGTYFVKLSASGAGITDCPFYKEVVIKPLEIPNVITPNGDGINDIFRAFGMYDYHLTVYNRWGTKVFEDVNYKNTFEGGDLSDGTYYYYIQYNDTGYAFKGWFNIIR